MNRNAFNKFMKPISSIMETRLAESEGSWERPSTVLEDIIAGMIYTYPGKKTIIPLYHFATNTGSNWDPEKVLGEDQSATL